MKSINRRTMLASSVLAVGAASLGMEEVNAKTRRFVRPSVQESNVMKRYPNEYFYDKDGKFIEERAKEAFYEMFRFYGYEIVPQLKTADFWVVDFGLGDFANCGMGGIFWMNNQKYSYFGHEIYLLPGQMIAEHKHVKTEFPCKMESWQVRYGSAYNFSEGEVKNATPKEIPASQRGKTICTQCEYLVTGDIRHLEVPETWHFLLGGDKGAIITEYANYHDGAGLKFSNPDAKL
ncbi:MAG: hypothetical protein Q4C96_00160 [Planctomycetia bacterium]|nr:hypothetical protein [Planctomycetia bacterium]